MANYIYDPRIWGDRLTSHCRIQTLRKGGGGIRGGLGPPRPLPWIRHCRLSSVSSRSLGCLDAPGSTGQLEAEATRELKQRPRRRQRERQKSSRFRLVKQQLCTCITLFDTFLCRRCTTTTWKCLNSRFVEDGNTRQRHSSSFPELRYSPLEFNSKQIRHHFVNWTRWKELD